MKKYTFPEEQRAILEKLQMPLAVYQFIDRRVVTLILSDGFLELSGYPDRETATFDMDRDMYKGTHPDDKARISEAALHFATEDSGYNVVYRSRKVGASEYSVIHAFGRHVTTKDGVRLAYIWYADEGMYSEDNPKRRARLNAYLNNTLYENSILKASRYDFLTGLPNITYFFELVDSARDSVIAGGGRPTLLFFDLCGLKFYNHKYGFAEGDRLLQSFSKLLAREFGSDNCCHVGQDHFAAFAEGEGLEDRIRRLFDSMSDVYIDAPPLRVGIYFDEDDDTVPVSVACDRAKLACDLNRGATESVFCYYSHDLRDRIVKKQYIIENLDRALKERWIEAYFQPIIRSVNGKVCDEEALSRWNDPVKGMLSPSEFIPPLEETGLIYKLDLYLLERVLEKINIQKASGIHIVPHSINLSRADFDACDVVEEIRRRVDEAGVERDKISIEITESVIGSNLEYMKEQITRFRDLGFKVWMDDFGNAYSSLDVLQSIQFDLIKFDMNFLKKLDESESAKIILTELMKMAASLGLDTICEGVEKESHLRFLKEIGCSKLQGYYFCRPISFEELNERYRTGGQIGYEDPAEEEYYKALGGVNLYDISVIAGDDAESFSNS
ncbi:MAG: EAL domain-containing protein, partial [Clostridia bacterium]|nr:EAL domain-containing protein [Clostridia bacterium]